MQLLGIRLVRISTGDNASATGAAGADGQKSPIKPHPFNSHPVDIRCRQALVPYRLQSSHAMSSAMISTRLGRLPANSARAAITQKQNATKWKQIASPILQGDWAKFQPQRVALSRAIRIDLPPVEDTNQLIEQRRANLAALAVAGIDPFANKFTPAKPAERPGQTTRRNALWLSPAGWFPNGNGQNHFRPHQGHQRQYPVVHPKNDVGEEAFKIFKGLDLADFVGANGALFTTKTGEISVKVTNYVVLAKSLRPPPDKWHGLADQELRYRQRYLDLIANDEVRDTFLKRSAIIREIRNFLSERGYVEVETPIMQAIPGGAAARLSSRITTPLAATSSCVLLWSCTSSVYWLAALIEYLRSAATSATKASRAGITRSSPCSRPTRLTAITKP